MEPYATIGTITIYRGDCRDILPGLGLGPAEVALLSDPPYGIGAATDNASRSRSVRWHAADYPPVAGDDAPFDPAHLLGYGRVVLFGANHYADRLPPSAAWLSWDKLDGLESKRAVGFNNSADCELAWSNLPGPARVFRHRWMGLMRASERGRRLHPTQKPVALMRFVLRWAGEHGTVVDPYCGCGPTLVAAALAGLPAVGIELVERYCMMAAARVEAAVKYRRSVA